MSDSPTNQKTVKIFDKEYRVACPEGQEHKLAKAADFLNQRMQEMKDSGASLGNEQTAAITALNLAHELLERRFEQQRQRQNDDAEIYNRLQTIKERLDVTVQRRVQTRTTTPVLKQL